MLNKLFLLMTALGLVVSLSACTSTEVEGEDAEVAELGGDAAEMAEGEDAFALDEDFAASDSAIADLGSSELAPDEQLPEDFGSDPFATDVAGADPFADSAAGGNDPFADPGAGGADPFADSAATDPFADGGGDPFAMDGTDPFAEPAAPSADEFAGAGEAVDPFAEPAESAPMDDPFAEPTESMETADMGGMMEEPVAPIAEPLVSEPLDTSYSDTMAMDDMDSVEPVTPERAWVPVKKIADVPFRKNGVLVNSVYIARPGDTIDSVSQKIYGTDRTEDLYTVNPHFRTRQLKTGAKVYYNSPNRPGDETTLLTYYEDIGLSPEIYVTREGDNIRAVASELLGDENAWKEVWATNPNVESKGEVVAGLQLRYWGGADVPPSMPMASNTPPPPAPAPSMNDMGPPPDDMAMNDLPPPPAEEPAFPDMPSDMPQSSGQLGDMAMEDELPPPPDDAMAPPPPPAQAMVEPPPPPPPPPSNPPPAPSRATAEQPALDDEIVMFGGIALLLVAGIMFIVLRKKKAKRQLDFNTSTQTQIE